VHLEDQLLFLLYDVQVSPLQEILACEFGMVQSTAKEWIQLLSDILKKALDHGGYVPARDPTQLATVLAPATESTSIDLQKMNWKFRPGFHKDTGVSLIEHLPNNP